MSVLRIWIFAMGMVYSGWTLIKEQFSVSMGFCVPNLDNERGLDQLDQLTAKKQNGFKLISTVSNSQHGYSARLHVHFDISVSHFSSELRTFTQVWSFRSVAEEIWQWPHIDLLFNGLICSVYHSRGKLVVTDVPVHSNKAMSLSRL